MDEFDSLINLEQTFYDDGFKDGYAHGRIHGLIEGRALGREKGFEMWEELGYYEGFASTWKALLVLRGTVDGRLLHHITTLLDLVSHFPLTNPSHPPSESMLGIKAEEEVDILKLLRQIRSKYKLLCSSLGIRPRVHAADGSIPPTEPGEEGRAVGTGKKSSIWDMDGAGDDEDEPRDAKQTQGQLLSF